MNSLKNNYKSLYAAFDPYPSYKGSAIHIEKSTAILSAKHPNLLVLSLQGPYELQNSEYISHQVFQSEGNYLQRATSFSSWVDELISKQYNLQVAQFRDIWSGIPIVKRKHITSIFEVNGLPSIELKNRYPILGTSTLEKIRDLENECLREASKIICPSITIKKHLINRNIPGSKINVIPNGADIPRSFSHPDTLPANFIVYFGALQSWQGVDCLIKSLKYLADYPELKLIICSSHKEKLSRPLQKLATRLSVSDMIIWQHQLHKDQLHQIIQHAICTIAPLTECERNLEQGCSPLKIFESMACATPVVASDLPVVREIISDGQEGKLIRPDRPAELARICRLLIENKDYAARLGKNAFEKLTNNFTWKIADSKLEKVYDSIYDWVDL